MVSHRHLRPGRGFTLPEVLTVLAILGILGAIAAPSFSSLLGTMRARSISSELYASLARARSEAIKRNAEVTLQAATPAAEPATGGLWHTGWNIPDPGAPARQLDVRAAFAGATVTGPVNVVFLPNGRVRGGATPSFDVAVTGSTQHRCVSVDLGGRPNQTASACPP